MFYSQEKLLQQLRARKVKLQQSKSDRLIKLMSDGGRGRGRAPTTTTTTTVAPLPRLDVGHLESPLTESSLDQLLARLESLEVTFTEGAENERDREELVFSGKEERDWCNVGEG